VIINARVYATGLSSIVVNTTSTRCFDFLIEYTLLFDDSGELSNIFATLVAYPFCLCGVGPLRMTRGGAVDIIIYLDHRSM